MPEELTFYIDIEDATGIVGPGPITTAARWSYTARMDRAGSFSFEMPASDPKASIVRYKRKARGWAQIGGGWVEVGAGIIDVIERTVAEDGLIWLRVSGDDEIRELAGRSVGGLDLTYGGAGASHAGALNDIDAQVTSPWTFLPAASPGNNFVYGRFAGESVLAALVQVAEKTLTHFYRSGPRVLTFRSQFVASGLRAIKGRADMARKGDNFAETCAITALTETIDTYDLLTVIHPFGAGNGEARLTLAATTRTPPAGYAWIKEANWISNLAAVAQFGVIDAPWIEFKDVRPVSNTDADLAAAADVLFDLAIKELERRAVQMQAAHYQVSLARCWKLLLPLQTLHIAYRDVAAGMDIDVDVNILSATWEVGPEGVQTTAVELSTGDTWPETDEGLIGERVAESGVYQAHPQLNANAYVIAYTKHLDDDRTNPAEFRFRFDQEVTQLTRVVFDFQLLPLESTVKSSGGTSTSTAASGDHSHSVTLANHTHSLTVLNHQHTVTVAGHQHSMTVAGHQHSVTLADHWHGFTLSDHSHFYSFADHTHGYSFGNHQHTVPNHQHYFVVDPGSNSIPVYAYSGGGSDGGLMANGLSSQIRVWTSSSSGAVTSDGGGGVSTTTGAGGGQSTTTGGGGGTSTTTGNGGGVTATTVAGGGFTQSTVAGGSFSQTSDAGGGFTQSSDAGGATVVTAASGGSHTHTVTAAVTTTYGIFRDDPANVFALGDLEYSLDAVSWFYFIPGVNGYAFLGDGWNRIDLTSLTQDFVTFRPIHSNNLLQIRRKIAGTLGKRTTIDAQMSIRTIIQSIAYT